LISIRRLANSRWPMLFLMRARIMILNEVAADHPDRRRQDQMRTMAFLGTLLPRWKFVGPVSAPLIALSGRFRAATTTELTL
jgi:hypothetical protein